MDEQQLEDLRRTLEEWQGDEEVSDRDMREALLKIVGELR
jgi:hypothetical protein